MAVIPTQPVAPYVPNLAAVLLPNPSTDTYSITVPRQGIVSIPPVYLAFVGSAQNDAILTFDLPGWNFITSHEITNFSNLTCSDNSANVLVKLYWIYAKPGSGSDTYNFTLGAVGNGVLFGLVASASSGYYNVPPGVYQQFPNPLDANPPSPGFDINLTSPPASPYSLGDYAGGLFGTIGVLTLDLCNNTLYQPETIFPLAYPAPPSPWNSLDYFVVCSNFGTSLSPPNPPVVNLSWMTQSNNDLTNSIGSGAVSFNTTGNGGMSWALSFFPVVDNWVPTVIPYQAVVNPEFAIALPCTPCCCTLIGYPI